MKIRQWTAALLTAGFLMSGVGAGAAEIDPAKPDCETAVIGDVNRDGLVQVDDATLVQCIVAGIVTADDLLTLRLADADGSGVCDIADATAIQQSCADIDAGGSLVGKPYDEVYGAETPTEPEITEPVTTEPVTTEPEATEPEATEPVTTEPEATEPEATEPETTEPVTTEPVPGFLKLNAESVKLGDNEDFLLSAESDIALDLSRLTFESVDEAVAAVDADGLITAVGSGETDVICRYDGLYDICRVTVCPAASSLSLNRDTLRLGVGESFDLDSYVNSGAAAYYRAYSSDNEAVAAVTEAGGIVTAQSEGTADITCTLRNGVKAVCKLIVEPLAAAVALNRTELTMGVGEVFDFDSTVSGGAAYVRAYSSDDESVVTVTESYGYATAQQVGETTVRCTLINGAEATCRITVKPIAPSLSLNRTAVTLAGGERFDFNSSVPEGTAAYYRAYYSEDPSVARIELEGGLMTAVREGTTRIYCELQNGTRVYAKVTVTPAVRKVMLDYLNEQIGNNNRSYIKYINANSDYECHSGTHWCAVFVWCVLDHVADRLGMTNPVKPCMYVSDIAEEAKDERALRNLADTGYVPSPGDIFITADSAHPEYDCRNHIGFVESVERDSRGRVTKVHTIEGNFGWETTDPSITRVTRNVLYQGEKDDYGMFICEYINVEYLFPGT